MQSVHRPFSIALLSLSRCLPVSVNSPVCRFYVLFKLLFNHFCQFAIVTTHHNHQRNIMRERTTLPSKWPPDLTSSFVFDCQEIWLINRTRTNYEGKIMFPSVPFCSRGESLPHDALKTYLSGSRAHTTSLQPPLPPPPKDHLKRTSQEGSTSSNWGAMCHLRKFELLNKELNYCKIKGPTIIFFFGHLKLPVTDSPMHWRI